MLFLCAARLSPSWRWQTAPVQIATTDNPSGNCLWEFQRCSLWQKPLYKSLFKLEVLFKRVWTVMVCCVMGVGSSAEAGWTLPTVVSQEPCPVGCTLGVEIGLGWLPFTAILCLTLLLSYSFCEDLLPHFFQILYLGIHRTRGVFFWGGNVFIHLNFLISLILTPVGTGHLCNDLWNI